LRVFPEISSLTLYFFSGAIGMYEVVVVGAGVAGLNCARQLQIASDQKILVIDKSRGLGGRLATRRLAATHADHGVCYLKAHGERFRQEIRELRDRGILRLWTEEIHRWDGQGKIQAPEKPSDCYVSGAGATAIAKYWAEDLEVIGDRTVTNLQPIDRGWQIEAQDWSVQARQVVLAVPPAQAAEIAGNVVDSACLALLRSIEFSPAITAMATYAPDLLVASTQLSWQGIQCQGHRSLAWIGLDSSKQLAPTQPVLVVQSNAEFAAQYFESLDLMAVGQGLIADAAVLASWLAQPQLLQVHRWAYAFPKNPLPYSLITAQTAAPLYFCGDWCGGSRVESAYLSGLAVAAQILQ
jgi:renalase